MQVLGWYNKVIFSSSKIRFSKYFYGVGMDYTSLVLLLRGSITFNICILEIDFI